MYEKIFREARVDSLTGAYNYRYFVDKLDEEYQLCMDDCLTLALLDVDDLRLYNQLYGVEEGDNALKKIYDEIVLCVGGAGLVFRTSGKVFALLLPGMDAHQASVLTKEIRHKVSLINDSEGRRQMKSLSVSVGICSSPYAASSAKELMDNTDLATYNAKQSGKDQTVIFKGSSELKPVHLEERTDEIVNRIKTENNDYHNALAMISALTAAIDAKDHYTCSHSKNVAHYSAALAVAAGLNGYQVRMIYTAGLLHDIGKISVPESVLNKTGKLTDTEYSNMKDHVNNSIEMIRHLPDMDYVIPAVLGHHERYDGYPRGIAGENIPVSARCLSIADVFDAMTTDRPYRKGLNIETATAEIERGAGTQFDPVLAKLFAKLVRSGDIVLRKQRDTEE
jgi:diguanylate cyclase (GGDEF)-like protein/putative nucleotidyltransferase with HDIG domain